MNPRYTKPAGCTGCSLQASGYGFAPPTGPTDARLIFIGEALGYEEAIHGEPFYGAAGGTLSRVLQRAGIDRRHVRIANVVSCRPPNDYLSGAPWEDHAINSCRQYLQPVLDAVPDNAVVVPLGATALTAILNLRGVPGITVKDFHGTITRSVDDRYWVVPTFHPSHLQRGAMSLLEVVTQDVQLANKISERGFSRSASQLVIDPHPDWLSAWVDDHLRRCREDAAGTHLSLDTEFAEKAGGADESELVADATTSVSPITRVNGGNDALTGWTVPYRQPYIGLIDRLLTGVQNASSWVWLWNKYADLDHLRNAGHKIDNYSYVDGMWLWHYLQSDLPRGLGFVAPMASDFGAWKHWGKDPKLEGRYAAADGLQNWRTCMWLLTTAARQRMWEIFLRDWHERDCYVLRPSYEQGVPINRHELERFHQELQRKLASVLARLKTTAAEGVLKPKLGYARKPTVKCDECDGKGYRTIHDDGDDGVGSFDTPCDVCKQTGRLPQLKPPASIIGKSKAGGSEAKSTYMIEGVRLVEREVEVTIRVCVECGAQQVGPRHRCPQPKAPRLPKGTPKADRASAKYPRPVGRIETRVVLVPRYFWQLPFNPDAPAQVLGYLASQSIPAPIDKKKQRATTNKKALKQLQEAHKDDPFFQLQLDWKAVQKVDATYAVGTLARLDKDDRVHPEILPAPSTFRDASRNPNIQNVVADKAGPEGLASGFRRCVEARDGVPSNRTADELAAWEARWS